MQYVAYINYISTYTHEALASLGCDLNIIFKHKSGRIKGINGSDRNHEMETIVPLHVLIPEIFRSIDTFSVNYVESTKNEYYMKSFHTVGSYKEFCVG